jgi:hypothetical protein
MAAEYTKLVVGTHSTEKKALDLIYPVLYLVQHRRILVA